MKYFALLTILLIIFDNCNGDIDANSLFVTKTLVTYNEALQTCKSRGMRLVRVDSAEDNAVVNGFANKVLVDAYWIDGNDHNSEGVFVDAKGQSLPYRNFATNEPNGGRGENCINIYRVPSGLWADLSCVARIWAICEKVPKLETLDQLEIEGSIFVASKSKISFADAKEYCIVRGLRMVRVNHVLDNSIVHSFARETNSDYYWLDGNDIETEGKWVDADGNDLLHKNFAPGEPNGQRVENCAHGYLTVDGLWNDIRCDLQLWAICYNETRRGVSTDPNALIASHDRLTWNEAQDYCKAQGYKMVRVNNAGENGIVHGFTRRIWADLYWLDGNDAKTEGRWVDSDNDILKHKGFYPGEPNGGVNENCLNGYTYHDALMNDYPCTYKNLYAICARDALNIRFSYDYDLDSEKMIVSTERYTYNEALQFCRTRGTQLARVNSASDNQALASFAKRVVADYYWIDGNDYTEEGKWVDSNGKDMQYKNWAVNEPNGNRGENCVFSYYLEEGTWRDVVCYNKYLAICTFMDYKNIPITDDNNKNDNNVNDDKKNDNNVNDDMKNDNNVNDDKKNDNNVNDDKKNDNNVNDDKKNDNNVNDDKKNDNNVNDDKKNDNNVNDDKKNDNNGNDDNVNDKKNDNNGNDDNVNDDKNDNNVNDKKNDSNVNDNIKNDNNKNDNNKNDNNKNDNNENDNNDDDNNDDDNENDNTD